MPSNETTLKKHCIDSCRLPNLDIPCTLSIAICREFAFLLYSWVPWVIGYQLPVLSSRSHVESSEPATWHSNVWQMCLTQTGSRQSPNKTFRVWYPCRYRTGGQYWVRKGQTCRDDLILTQITQVSQLEIKFSLLLTQVVHSTAALDITRSSSKSNSTASNLLSSTLTTQSENSSHVSPKLVRSFLDSHITA